MRVVINGRFLGQATTGVQRYAAEVVKRFDRLIAQEDISTRPQFVLAVPTGTPALLGLDHIAVEPVGRLGGHIWEQLELDHFAADDLLLCLCNVAPMRRRRQIVTLHDASVFAQPAAYSRAFRTWYRLVQRQVGARALMILTDSEFSSGELQRYLRIPQSRIRVVPLGSDHLDRVAPDQGILARHGLEQRPFVLAVSSLAPHKNFVTVLEAFALLRRDRPDLDLVVAGGRFHNVFGAAELPESGAIQVGYVTDAELKALYLRAACFVYPSLYEGFGLPPLEAMACGCPVVLSTAASLPEVAEAAVIYFEPKDPASLAGAVLRVLDQPDLQQHLRDQGRARAAALTWDRCASRTFALLQQALVS